MEDVERERLVADAILLERAAWVLVRRRPERDSVPSMVDRHDTSIHVLREKARELRQEAESGA